MNSHKWVVSFFIGERKMQLNKINKKCLECERSCKQFSSQTILYCRLFKRKKKEKRLRKVVDLIEKKAVTTA